MNHTEDDFETWELEWQDYASDPDTLDRHTLKFHVQSWALGIAAAMSLVLVWVGIIATILGIVHWLQGLIP